MSNVIREDKDNLNTVLKVTIKKEDYEPLFKSELNKYRQKASMKGFRKGKTPITVLKKMYGKSVLAEVVNQQLQKELFEYIRDEKIEYLGDPLPTEEQPVVDFDVKEMKDFEFAFDLGLMPEFEVKGISAEDTYERYEVEVSDEAVEEELQNARRRLGERVDVEEDIQEKDVVTLEVKELEGEEVKEDGVTSEFSLLIERVKDETAKEELLSKKKGDTLRLNLFTLEDMSAERVRNYYLKLEEADDREINEEFKATIIKVTRMKPAELNQDLFDKHFGEGKVSSEEEAREKIREDVKGYYDRQADGLLFRDIQEKLLQENPLELPDEFLKRWLQVTNEKLTAEQIEKEYEGFQKNMQWTLIRRKVQKEKELSVSQEELMAGFKQQIKSYYGAFGANDAILDSFAQRMLEDRKQVDAMYEQLMTDKVFESIKGDVSLTEKPVSSKEMDDIITEVQEKMQAEELAARAVAEEEE